MPTVLNNNLLPSMTRSIVASFRATSASRHAAHSTAEPLASSKNFGTLLPLAFAVTFSGVEQRGETCPIKLIANLAIQTLSSRADLRQENRRPCDKGQLHLINIELLVVEDGLVIHCLNLVSVRRRGRARRTRRTGPKPPRLNLRDRHRAEEYPQHLFLPNHAHQFVHRAVRDNQYEQNDLDGPEMRPHDFPQQLFVAGHKTAGLSPKIDK